MQIIIDQNKLDNSFNGTMKLEGKIFAYQGPIEYPDEMDYKESNKPTYLVFVDTSEHEKLWSEVTKDFKPGEDWTLGLRRLYIEQPGLEKRLSKQCEYGVPPEAFKIPHDKGGAHGDLRLRYGNANVLFFPVNDYNYLKSEYSDNWKILCENLSFLKGNKDLSGKYGVQLV